MVCISVSTVASASIASTPSLISSKASGPMMWTPRISPYFSSATIFTNPSCRPRIEALLSAAKGNLPILTLYPCARACASVSPTLPMPGSV